MLIELHAKCLPPPLTSLHYIVESVFSTFDRYGGTFILIFYSTEKLNLCVNLHPFCLLFSYTSKFRRNREIHTLLLLVTHRLTFRYFFCNENSLRFRKNLNRFYQFSSFLFYPQSHLQGVKSRQNLGEAALCKTAKESTQRLYLKPKTVR